MAEQYRSSALPGNEPRHCEGRRRAGGGGGEGGKRLHVATLAVDALGRLLGVTQALCRSLFKGVVVAAVLCQFAGQQVDDVGAYCIQEFASVAHHQHCLWPLEQVVLHPPTLRYIRYNLHAIRNRPPLQFTRHPELPSITSITIHTPHEGIALRSHSTSTGEPVPQLLSWGLQNQTGHPTAF